MECVSGAEFRDQTVRFNKEFTDCRFENCELVFDGAPVKTFHCTYINCNFRLEGAAIETLRFLHLFWTEGAWDLVEQIGVFHTGQAIRFSDPDQASASR